tara:strand:- start:40 stop:381 length:342 start_codon:yes stop_codon:yes gene_type:complete
MALTFRTGSGGKGSALTIEELDNNFRHFTGSHEISGSLIISGSIEITGSATGDFTGSFDGNFTGSLSGSNLLNVGTAIFESLPTSEPTVTGSLWLSGSAGAHPSSSFLMVYNP